MGLSVLTLYGMEMAWETMHTDSTLWDDVVLPEGVDRQLVADRCLNKAGEFSVMHSDPEFFHWQMLNFFKSHQITFEKWWEVMQVEYNPIENYDRMEHWTDSGTHSDASSGTNSESQESYNKNSYHSNDETTKAAFNSNDYDPYEKTTHGGYDETEGNASGTSFSAGSSQGNTSGVHDGRVHGNIGVTTSQQMIQSSIDLYTNFEWYERVADLFTDEFCIKVY